MIPLVSLEDIGKAFVPKRFRPGLRSYFIKAGITEVPYRLFGILFWASFAATTALYIMVVYPFLLVHKLSALLFFGGVFAYWAATLGGLMVLVGFGVYSYVDMQIYNRTKKMEEVLPDFLRFVSENLKGGMSIERSLWSAIRPEFGVLANEVRLAAKKVMTGTDVEDALHEFTEKYESPTLRRSFELVAEGIKGGTPLAELIDRIVEDVEQARKLKAEISATNLNYTIFIGVVSIIVAPALFALSYQFLIILQGFAAKIGTSTGQGTVSLPISFGSVSIEPAMFRQFSNAALTLTAVSSAAIISMIQRSDIKGGIKYMPGIVIATLAAYNIFLGIVTVLFSSLLQ